MGKYRLPKFLVSTYMAIFINLSTIVDTSFIKESKQTYTKIFGKR